ncbi:hypothetical protein ZOSMA_141G00330 [Zostera marina]|uniref:Autophagy-related protein 27 n=1 Tax=Zostera marina TaxID=29655 RepID=A0A0K9PZX8_ZOSMR|nr:hypothetical protein ZOSMA_141G00330 [Zostera marina]
MLIRQSDLLCTILIALLSFRPLFSLPGKCDLSIINSGAVYNYNLADPIEGHSHGVLSADGFYKVASNETLLWFQLCDLMLFNHDPPRCFNCKECGGSSKCGTQCNALVSNFKGGYPVCTVIGKASSQTITPIDDKYPKKGVMLKMFSIDSKTNCSLSVSIFCDPNSIHEPNSLSLLGTCNYATSLSHPSGCPEIISGNGSGGWFGTFLIVSICSLGAYLMAGATYRYFGLGIHGVQVIPNLEFWVSLPQRGQSLLGDVFRSLSGRNSGSQGSYAPPPSNYQ